MFTEWATRRLFKFLLKKRIGRYIRGDLDLEQLDVQLGSGIAQLNDVALNVDYINEQISESSLELKDGSVGSVTLKLQWKVFPTINIELDGVELVFIPRKSTTKCEAEKINPEGFYDSIHESHPLEGDVGGSGFSGANAYIPVQEGVRVVANLVEKLLLGMHVSVRHIIVAFAGTTQSSCVSHSMLICRLGCAEYNISYLADQELDKSEKEHSVGGDSVLLTNTISFDQLTLEILDVLHNDYESSAVVGNGTVFGQPVPLLQNDHSLSGCIKLSVPWKNGCLNILKLDADVSISDINLQFTYEQIPQFVSVVSSYAEYRTDGETDTSHRYGSNECTRSNYSPSIEKEQDDIQITMDEATSDPATSQSNIPKLSVLPGTKLISDWVRWHSTDNCRNKEDMSETDFATSTEEFFDCFDDTRSSQAILTGSGLWTWTCSAFNAITAASSLASGSILMLQESNRQIEYDVKINVRGISIILKEGTAMEKTAVLNPGTSKKSLVSWLSESVIASADYSREDHIVAIFLDIHCVIQVSPRNLRCEVIASQIEVFEIKHQHEDIKAYGIPMMECISTSSQTLQALIEKSLPAYPVSLCESRELTKVVRHTRKCLLRFSDQLPAGKCLIEHEFPCLTEYHKGSVVPNTSISLHFQPVIVWFDAKLGRKLQTLADIIGSCSNNDLTATAINVNSEVRSMKQVDIHVPSLRLLTTAPFTPGSESLKSHILCFDLSTMDNMKIPFLKFKQSDRICIKHDPQCFCAVELAFRKSTLYIVSPSESSEYFGKQEDLCFKAQGILYISSDGFKMATVKVTFREKSAGGSLLAEQAWIGVTQKQKGGIGSRKMNSEFAAATATEELDKKNEKIRDELRNFSSVHAHVVIPHVKVELNDLQLCAMIEFFSSVTEALPFIAPDVHMTAQKDCYQTSVSVDVQKIKIMVQCNLISSNESSILSERKDSSWGSYVINVTRFQLMHVMHVGMIKDVSYFWFHHENGSIAGLLLDKSPRELQLLTCRNDALGRGDGSGGNALATSSAGLELLMIVWPGIKHEEDMLMTVTIRGCTFMAHGGRLDWVSGLMTFACPQVDRDLSCKVIEEKWYLAVPETVLFKTEVGVCMTEDAPSTGHNCILFSLDLHDAALCYEPGKEAISAANIRAKAEDSPNDMDRFSPVACTIAAAAVRVSSNAISNKASKDYVICLRDVAVLLADTTLRRNRILDYTSESLHGAGYVRVAGEAVVEAIVRLDSEQGLRWEVECANSQLHLDTCHDTTAALGRLIAQLQQLLTPEVDHLSSRKRWQHDTGAGYVENLARSEENSHVTTPSRVSFINTARAVPFVENLPEAPTFGKGNLLHSYVGLEERKGEKFDMTTRMDSSSDDGTDESVCNPLDHILQDGEEAKDYWIPISQNDEVPSFIEDYYVPRKSSPHSSGSFSSNHSIDEFDTMVAVEGSGGWYDGHSFNVLENHVPIEKVTNACKRQRGILSHNSKRRTDISSKYPPSIGRIVFQDLNLRWRLYGGSDWVGIGQTHGSRQAELCLEVICNGVDLEYDTFSETGEFASRMDLSIRDVWIYDCSQEAPWRKILGYKRSKSCPRESSAKALKLELESVRPDPSVPLEEYRLSLKLLPILLHIDQRHLDFLTSFFSSPLNSSQQLHLGYEEIFPHFAGLEGSTFSEKNPDSSEEIPVPFFQTCEVQPFSIRVDYVPRRVDIGALRAGNYAELFNLFSWKGIELNLKHIQALGIHGWGALSGVILGEWLEDISHNQIHKVIKGIGPIRPLFAVGSGAAKLIVLPAEHYKRDRRSLLRGMRKGAIAFLHSISLETVGLGVQLAAGAHEILLQTESALGSVGLSSSSDKVDMPVKSSQPGDLREGLQQACESLTRGLERTASSLIGNPVKAYQRGARTSSAVATALRAAPAAAVAPATAAAGAVHRALLGVRNSLDPEHRRESEEKHSGPPLESDSEMFL